MLQRWLWVGGSYCNNLHCSGRSGGESAERPAWGRGPVTGIPRQVCCTVSHSEGEDLNIDKNRKFAALATANVGLGRATLQRSSLCPTSAQGEARRLSPRSRLSRLNRSRLQQRSVVATAPPLARCYVILHIFQWISIFPRNNCNLYLSAQ